MGRLVRLEGIGKRYLVGGEVVQALSDVSVEIERGEFVAVVGPSGSGKSTLLSILGCLDRPSQGRYFLDETDMSSLDRSRLARVRNTCIGFVFQNFGLLPRLTALENVQLPLFYRDEARADGRTLAERLLRRVGLGMRSDHRPAQMSGGEQQRVAIARAVINDPELLLADEPTGALDTRTGEEILSLLQELHRAGLTLLVATHNPAVAAQAGRIICLRDGAVTSDERSAISRLASANGRELS
ncbi:ABC transporter ATP-binding protein [Microvirga massiliensis]|uniref:ABC transporter ATP-binding protein n=1 Tax=Microvirga massiliensis TaxID=1033741 RepID=UPI00062B9911|nr:ABC transporter ATP-binding protein [Microvirga massiliensis]